MRIAKNLLVAALAALAAAGPATAQPMRDCHRYETKVSGEQPVTRWGRKLSLAGCLRQTARDSRDVRDPELLRAMVRGLAASVERPIQIYREVMGEGPWELRLLAAYSLGTTYIELAVRARVAVARSDGDLTAAARSDELHAALEPLLEPYKYAAIEAFAEAETIANEIPVTAAVDDLVRNVVGGTTAALDAIGLD